MTSLGPTAGLSDSCIRQCPNTWRKAQNATRACVLSPHAFHAILIVLTAAAGTAATSASEFKIGEINASVKGVVSVGTTLRTESPAPSLIYQPNGAAVGVVGTAAGGRGLDDGNLNFRKGEPVSTVAKTLVDAEFKYRQFGAFVRAIAWHDFTLAGGDRPWGNVPNAFAPGVPLGDASNRAYGRFSGAAFLDANVYGTVRLGQNPLHLRLGNQTIPWGTPSAIAGNLSIINPLNLPAIRRAGVLPEETRLAIPAVFARLGVTPALNLEAFYQLAFVRNELDACGTFVATDYLADRCDKVFLGAGLNDRQSLAAGLFGKRASDIGASNGGQFGVGLTYRLDSIATQFGAYYARHHSRAPYISAIRSGRTLTPFLPGDPDGLNPRYALQYPEGIHVFAANFATRLPGTTLFGEVSHRPNQPVQLNSGDILNAFASNTAPTPLRADASATPLGGLFPGFDRLATTDVQLGFSKPLGAILGAQASSLVAELGVKYVHDLPNVTQRRYGRADVYGTGPVNGVCPPDTPPLGCSNNGFVSRISSGVRMRGTLTYAEVAPGVDIIPSVFYGYDIQGWAYDGIFNSGRHLATVSLRAEYQKRLAFEIAYAPLWGGRYNNYVDRDMLALSMSARF